MTPTRYLIAALASAAISLVVPHPTLAATPDNSSNTIDSLFVLPSEPLTLTPRYLDDAPTSPSSSTSAPEHVRPSASSSTEGLAKAAQNPVADMISVPFQSNFNFGVGPSNSLQYVLNFQPVIPVHLSDDWNLITRTIIPFINQASPAPGISSDYGLGDTTLELFLSPAKPGEWIWGVGPIFQFPTATDTELGQGQWGIGPTAVVLRSDGHWLYGVLANQLWSYAGESGRPALNQMLVQPFVNYNFPHGWYLVSAPIITANWRETAGNAWTVPVGGGVGKIIRIGKLPINVQVEAFANVVRPDNGPDWQLRAQITFLFPR